MAKKSSVKTLLKIREQNILFLEEYTNLITMIGSQDQAMIQAMFLGFSAESIGADRVTLYGHDKNANTLYPNVTMVYENKKVVPYDYYSELKDVSIKIGDDVCGIAASTKKPIFIKNISSDKRYKGYVEKKIKLKSRALIVIPIIIDNELISVLEVAATPKNRPLTQVDLNVVSIIAQITLITMEKTKLYDWSVTDNLTQLKNYQFLQISMEKELARSKRYPQDVGVIMMDIDNFKSINDTYGHLFGNVVLKEVANIIMEVIRTVDVPVRYGGDEFLLLLPQTHIKGAELVASRILKKTRAKEFITDDNKKVHASISIGVTAAKKNNFIDKEALIKKADDALYMAKKQGKNASITLE